ncbi:hypothetical protein VCRA2119O48_110003 [Vibrio crassostreae]|nr:hypothetical protein VCRA2119O48_110003 [Vibrio crassostreae]CAK3921280.1 hypothetical protein VCRA212O16_380002 [Vibrio crassostreae]
MNYATKPVLSGKIRLNLHNSKRVMLALYMLIQTIESVYLYSSVM